MYATIQPLCSKLFALVAVSLAVAMTGCSTVTVQQPFGQPASAGVTEKLNGAWQMNDQIIHMAAVDGETVRLAGVEFEDGKYKLNELDARIRELDGRHYVFVKGENADDDYSFVRMVLQEKADTIVVYAANVEKFAELVRDGKLKGEVKRDKQSTSVKLASEKPELEATMTGEGAAELFNTENPMVLRRVGSK